METSARLGLARQVDETFDLAALLPWLRTVPSKGRASRDAEALFFIFNEILETFRRKEIENIALSTCLSAILASSDLHPVIRDYAAQHLGLLAQSEASLHPVAVAAFCQVLESELDRNQPIAGTIINVLNDLRSGREAGAGGLLLEQRVDLALVSLAALPDLLPSVRIPLLQGTAPEAGTAAAESFLMLVRNFSQDPAQTDEVRLAAIGTLGRLGTVQDLQLLYVLDASSSLLSTAANAAADRLNQAHSPSTQH